VTGVSGRRLTEGEVRDVQTDETDEYWSVNIKKGLVSLFQVKINGRSTIIEDSSQSFQSFRQRNRFYELVNPLARRSRSLASDNILKVMEVRQPAFTPYHSVLFCSLFHPFCTEILFSTFTSFHFVPRHCLFQMQVFFSACLLYPPSERSETGGYTVYLRFRPSARTHI